MASPSPPARYPLAANYSRLHAFDAFSNRQLNATTNDLCPATDIHLCLLVLFPTLFAFFFPLRRVHSWIFVFRAFADMAHDKEWVVVASFSSAIRFEGTVSSNSGAR